MKGPALKLERPHALEQVDAIDKLELAARLAVGLAARYDGGVYDGLYGHLAKAAFDMAEALLKEAKNRAFEEGR